MAIKMRLKTKITIHLLFLQKTCISLKAKQKNEHRHFFMNRSGQTAFYRRERMKKSIPRPFLFVHGDDDITDFFDRFLSRQER